jgi:hypothetical protein
MNSQRTIPPVPFRTSTIAAMPHPSDRKRAIEEMTSKCKEPSPEGSLMSFQTTPSSSSRSRPSSVKLAKKSTTNTPATPKTSRPRPLQLHRPATSQARKARGSTTATTRTRALRRPQALASPRDCAVRSRRQVYKNYKSRNHTPLHNTDTSVGECRRHGCQNEHDPEKMSICKNLLYKGSCSDEYCAVSHEPSPHNMPSCLHFLQGRCTKDDCRFIHANVGREATNCVAFGTLGYCEKGSACTELHLRECPFFSNKDFCHWKDSCRLGHVYRASRMKKSSLFKAPYVEATGPPTPPFAAPPSLPKALGPPSSPFAALPSLSKAWPAEAPGLSTSPIAAPEARSITKKSQISYTPPDFIEEPNYIPFDDSDDE